MKFGGILAICIVVAAVAVASWFGGRHSVKPVIEEKHDTTIVEHFVDRPVEVVKWKDKEVPVYIPVRDTIVKDSIVYVAVEREVKQYKDSTYEAQVSGVDPRLDWIKVFEKTVTTTIVEKDTRRWTFGITAGPGVVWNGDLHAGLAVVAGIQYRF